MMRKLSVYLLYLFEYLRYFDFISIYASVNYLLRRKSHKHDRIIRTSIGKFYCRRNTNDFQFANLKYEWSLKAFLFKSLHEYSVFIDSGACIGDYSILFSKYKLRCIAFEPMPANFQAMVKNFELNGLTKEIQVFPYGLGDFNGEAKFFFNPVNTGASSIDRENRQDTQAVEIRTLDSLMDELAILPGEHILIKLDAESMEPDVIRGAREFISRYDHLTLVMEDKFTGSSQLRYYLDQLAVFEYGRIDQYNMVARKLGNFKTTVS